MSFPSLVKTDRFVLKPYKQTETDQMREFVVIASNHNEFEIKEGDHVLVDANKCTFYHASVDQKLEESQIPFSMQRAWCKIEAIAGKIHAIDQQFKNSMQK